MLSRLRKGVVRLWRRIKVVDWLGVVLAILKAAKKEKHKVDPKYIAIKPRVLSDHNLLRGVAVIRAVVAFIPPAALAAPILSLGEIGFKIWKRIALGKEWDELVFPPIDPNVMRFSIDMNPTLRQHFGYLTLTHNWDTAAISELEAVYNDFSFITSFEILHAKYPLVEEEYLRAQVAKNRDVLQQSLVQIEQELIRSGQRAVVDTNVRDAVEALKTLFPAMRDWALFNSEGFDEVLELIDTIL